MRVLVALFLVAHGAVHLLYLAPPPQDDPRYPFIAQDRWLSQVIGASKGRTLATILAVVTAILYAIAGVTLLAEASVWEPVTVAATASSLTLLLAFFHPWLAIGVAIDLAILGSVTWWHVPGSLFEP